MITICCFAVDSRGLEDMTFSLQVDGALISYQCVFLFCIQARGVKRSWDETLKRSKKSILLLLLSLSVFWYL